MSKSKLRRQELEENGQRAFWFVFTTDHSAFSLPKKLTLPRIKFLEKEDGDQEHAA